MGCIAKIIILLDLYFECWKLNANLELGTEVGLYASLRSLNAASLVATIRGHKWLVLFSAENSVLNNVLFPCLYRHKTQFSAESCGVQCQPSSLEHRRAERRFIWVRQVGSEFLKAPLFDSHGSNFHTQRRGARTFPLTASGLLANDGVCFGEYISSYFRKRPLSESGLKGITYTFVNGIAYLLAAYLLRGFAQWGYCLAHPVKSAQRSNLHFEVFVLYLHCQHSSSSSWLS